MTLEQSGDAVFRTKQVLWVNPPHLSAFRMITPKSNSPGEVPQSWIWKILQHRVMLVVLVTGMVFGLSSIPFRTASPTWRWDKTLHILEYLGVGFIYLNFITQGFRHLGPAKVAGYLGVLVVVAALDENYQRFIPGRASNFRDFLASVIGGILALILAAWLVRRLNTGWDQQPRETVTSRLPRE